MRKILREPLFHFVLIGIAIFVVNEIVNSGAPSIEQQEIVLTEADIKRLQEQFARTWQRPPNADELAGLVDNRIREEVYYRQALGLGLDQDDLVIRRRLRQKMEFLSNDLIDVGEPSEIDLESFRRDHAELFTSEPIFSFDQVYFDPTRHDNAEQDMTDLRERLNTGAVSAPLESLGDNTMLPANFDHVSGFDVARYLGRSFVDRLEALEIGGWQGPVQSGYGLHLVNLKQRSAGQLPPLADIRERVIREWQDRARESANEAMYQRLLGQYRVIVRGEVVIKEQGDAK
ncbi:MAG: hypothetical protein DHS20C11_02380 [Lysobacteraceae bacterium]|nr:MAG: hypothetical protein DHS20C11_02380 [Xanthomonadaceae bacterium]